MVLLKMIKENNTEHITDKFPRVRNFILDIMRIGKKKNIVYAFVEADVTYPLKIIDNIKRSGASRLTLTGYISKCFADTITRYPRIAGYRKGRRKIVIFNDVDLAFMIEKRIPEYGEDYRQPVNYIVRAADKKTAWEITAELEKAKKEPLGGEYAMNEVEYTFWRFPGFLRKLIWSYLLKHPKAWKLFLGTAGVTSVGMFGKDPITVLPITPMTATLAIGTVFKKPKIEGERIVGTKYILNLTLAVDHSIVDGGLLMRFIGSFKEEIRSCRSIGLSETKIAE